MAGHSDPPFFWREEGTALKKRFFVLCLVVGLALCAMAALSLASPLAERPAPEPAPSYAPRPERTLAFLGDGQDPWCAPLFDQLCPWARDRDWSLITYDCAGSVKAQQSQLEDLLRTETAAAVILYDLGDGAWQTQAVETLEEAGVQVVTLSRWGEADVGLAPGQPWAAVMEYLDAPVLVLADLPEDPSLSAIQEALGDRLAGYGACWSTPEYAADYLDQALPLYPQVGGILCLSRAGALGAREALDQNGAIQPQALRIKVLCMDPGPETEKDLALGRIDAVAEVSQAGVLDALGQALEGQTPKPLDVQIRTALED